MQCLTFKFTLYSFLGKFMPHKYMGVGTKSHVEAPKLEDVNPFCDGTKRIKFGVGGCLPTPQDIQVLFP